jgi:class 3 adenylate cyclase/tetratricopeptide (TPR) repeat protein
VLFADLVGFTGLAERLDAEEVREITTECLRRLVAEVARYEGTVDKFIGDAVMALFGAPVAHEDDPARALRAALGMQRALEAFNVDLERERGLRLALRIGIETGEVVAGMRDVGGVREYTAIGDAVNVAARLQATTSPDSILVGVATEQRARSAFAFRPVPPLALRGKEQPVPAFVLVGPQVDAEAAVALRTPLVGRSDELRALEACLDELRRGRGQIAAVVGEPGIGKSRLLAESRARSADLRRARCQAFAHEGALSYGLARRLVRGLCELADDEPEATAGARLRARLEGLDCLVAYPALALLLSLPLDPEDGQRLAGLPPQELQRVTFDAVAELVGRLAASSSLVLELDDLHWADPSSIDLVLELMTLAEHGPILFCCAFRPERDAPSWALRERAARDFPHRYTEIVLRPLSEAASAELVAHLLDLEELPSGLRDVLERAAGTPLWVEELVRTLVERGLLARQDGGWRVAADLRAVEIPDTLQALIVARIDRLGGARPTLQTASVIGRRFGQRVLERVAANGPRLAQHLRMAERADLVRELAVIPEREYGFKHVLTQEAAYATLLVRRRRELHRRAAEALEALYPERIDELHAVLAHHYARAEAWAEGLEHARAAAVAAQASYANREALEQYSQALTMAEQAERTGLGPAARHGLFEARAQVYEVLGEFEPARADYEAALALAEEVGDATAEARLLATLGTLWGGHRDYQRGLELTRRAAAVAEAAGDRRGLAEAGVRVGVLRLNLAQMVACRRELERSLGLFRELGDEPGQARTLDVLAMATLCAGDFDQAVTYGREAIPRLRALGDRWTETSSTVTLGLSLAYRGERSEAAASLRRAITVCAEMGARGAVSYAKHIYAEAMEPFGAYELALREASEGLWIARELGHREEIAANLRTIGRVHRLCGDLSGARRLHEEMLAAARELGAGGWIAEALGELGQDAAQAGDSELASTLLAEAVSTASEALKFIVRALLGQAELALRMGRPAEALAAARRFREAAPRFRVLGPDAWRVEGEALAALGRVDEALAALRRAKAGAVAIGAEPPRWQACLALSDLLRATGRADEAALELAEALTSLEAVASSLTDPALRQAFASSEPMRRARGARRTR